MDNKTLSENIDDNERQRCEIWTRVMGYHRPVSEFNPGKQGEYRERVQFAETTATKTERA